MSQPNRLDYTISISPQLNASIASDISKVDTDTYIKNFNRKNNSICASRWMHDHPLAFKRIQISSMILGAGAVAAAPLSLPLLGIAVTAGIAVCGGGLLLTPLVSWLFQKYITSNKHEITEHAFKEARCEGGRLYYRGNIPILELDDANPSQAGQAHGYLLGEHIHPLKKNLDLMLHSLMREPRAPHLPNVIRELRAQIPAAYLQEMEGLTLGFNRWAEEAKITTRVTVDDVLLMHMIADSKHFKARQAERAATPVRFLRDSDLFAMACTTLLHRDPQRGVIFGRNMDWCPFGHGGGKSLLVVWKDRKVAALGVPGLIGAGTGWNQHRLAAAMNICPGETSECRGMPSMLYNRYILERATTVQEAEREMQQVRPLGPYHLTLADAAGNGSCTSFYQGENGRDHIRSLSNDRTLQVVNWRYPECKGGRFNSEGRTKLLNRYFDGANASIRPDQKDWYKLVENALSLTPLVNSWITLHSLMFLPGANEVSMSWDNGYAASMPRERIAMTEVFN